MSNPAVARTPEGMIAELMGRVDRLENRITLTPDRLNVNGRYITDWNQATEAGFYWSDSSALNKPGNNFATGWVLVNLMPTFERIQQHAMQPSSGNQTVTYHRVGFSPVRDADGRIISWSWGAWTGEHKGYNDFQPFMPAANGITFGAGWGSNITSPWGGVYVSRISGFVHIFGGAAKNAGWASGEEILALPGGFKTARSMIGVNCQIMAPSNITNGDSLQTTSASASAGNYNFSAIYPATG